MDDIMQNAIMGGGIMPGIVNPENLASNEKFYFSRMQNDLWETTKKTLFVHHR